MAELSDQLMAFTVLAYLAAMVCYAAEYAFGNRSHIGRAATRPSRQLVGAGAPAEVVAPGDDVRPAGDVPPVDDVVETVPRRDRGALLGLVGVGLTWVAFALHLGTVVTRGIAANRMPWGNMYEFILAVTLVGAAVWLGVLTRKPAVRHLGLFAALALVVLLGAAGLIAYTPVGPLVPALNSYMLPHGMRCAATPRVTTVPRCSAKASQVSPTPIRPSRTPRSRGGAGGTTSSAGGTSTSPGPPAPTSWRAGRVAARPMWLRLPNAYSAA